MNRRGGGVTPGMGGASILAIFVLLCLMTFVALSVVSAQADYRLTQKTAWAAKAYYAADAAAEERVEAVLSAAREEGWVEALAGYELTVGSTAATVAFCVPVDENKTLEVELELALDGAGTFAGEWRRVRWQSVVNQAPEEAEQPLGVLKRKETG